MRSLKSLLFAAMAASLCSPPALAQSQIVINEFYRAGNLGATDEWIEVVTLQPLTAFELQNFFIGDSTGTTAGKFSGYRLTNMGTFASIFPAGTIIVIAGTTGPAADTSYNPASGDWNLVLKTSGANILANGATGDLAATDVVYVDTDGTTGNATLAAVGHAVNYHATPGAFGAIASVTIASTGNNTGALNAAAPSGVNTAANWTIGTVLGSLTPGQPNGGANTTGIVALRNPVTVPALSISSPVPINEGTAGCVSGVTPYSFTVTATPAPAANLSFGWSTADGTAQDGGVGEDDDYTGTTGSIGVINAGATSGTITVDVRCDAKFENNETFNTLLRAAGSVAGTTAGSYTISGTNPVTATITNDDSAPIISLVAPAGINEGNGGGTTNYNFTINATGETALAVTVPVSAAGTGTNPADNPGDFGNPATPLVIPAWAGASTTASITVPVVADDVFEQDETFQVTLANPTNATIAAGAGSAVGTILNDDIAPTTPTITIGDPLAMTEPDTGTVNVSFPVNIAPAPTGTVEFSVATAADTATAPGDFTATSSGTQVFNATTTSYTFVVPVVGDCVIESPASERFFANVTLLSGSATIGDGQGEAVINDNDAAITATLSVTPATAAEGNSGTNTRTVTVTLSQPMQCDDLNFNLTSTNGSATAGDDYVALNETGLVLPQGGATTLSRTLTINGDLRNEAGEDLSIALGVNSGTNVATAGTPAIVTIDNDDSAPLAIPAIQGTGDASPQSGNTVTSVGNIVTAVVANGFVMQAPAPGDGNPGTSDGIFVFTSTAPVYTGTTTPIAVGDLVDLRGRVTEFNSTGGGRTLAGTQFTNTSPTLTINRVGTGSVDTLAPPLALDASIPSPSSATPACPVLGSSFPAGTEVRVQNFECYEYMRVSTASAIVSAPNQFFASDPIGEAAISPAGVRGYREPGVGFPVAGEDTTLAAITPAAPPLPAGFVWDNNPELIEFDADRLGQPNTALVPGTRLSATGVIGIDFADYEIWPSTWAIVGTAPTLPRAVPTPAADQLTIGSLNMLRLYDLCDDPARPASGEPSLTPTQIANTNAKLEKLSAYIREVLRSPDVLGAQEVEQPSPAGTTCANAGGTNVAALQLLADRIAADGGPTYSVAHGPTTNDPGFIAVAFLYRADRLVNPTFTSLAASEQFSFAYTDGNGALQTRTGNLNDRPTLLMQATSTVGAGNLPVAVMVNHLRSLGGIDDLRDTRPSGDPVTEPTYRQDAHRVRQKRLRQAVSLACQVQSFQANAANAGVPLVVLGDFNAFQFSDGYADTTGIIRGDTSAAQSEYDIGFDGTPPAPCTAVGGQIVQQPLNQGVFALPDAERYSFIFQNNAQVLDHAFLNQAASNRFEGFAYGRGNSDARSNLEFDVTAPNRVLRASDHDGFVLRLNATPGRPTTSGWLLFRDGLEQ